MRRLSLIFIIALMLSSSTFAGETGFASKYRLGYVFGQADVGDIAKLAEHTNVLLVDVLDKNVNEIVKAAKENKLGVVLIFETKKRKNIEKRIDGIIQKYPDAVLGVSWETPYWDDNSKSSYEAVKQFGMWLNEKHAGLEYWASFVERPRGKVQTQKIPPEVDVISVNDYFDPTPHAVRTKCLDNLPHWLNNIAEGRRVVLRWCNPGQGDGLVSKTEPGAMDMCRKVAEEYRLAGVIFSRYGEYLKDDGGTVAGIKNKSSLTDQIRELGGQWRGKTLCEDVVVKGISHFAEDDMHTHCTKVSINGVCLDKVTEVEFNNLTIQKASFVQQDEHKIIINVPEHTEGESVVKAVSSTGSSTFDEDKAKGMLLEAKKCFALKNKSGYTKCAEICRRIIKEYPDTRYSKFADKMLEKIPARYLEENPN
ncbi:MAG: hypothetical protein JW912_02860 [Sedimentisphaerales bacterium]|nr:hypothetical protein [Sedimentisphaerales bacterium]